MLAHEGLGEFQSESRPLRHQEIGPAIVPASENLVADFGIGVAFLQDEIVRSGPYPGADAPPGKPAHSRCAAQRG